MKGKLQMVNVKQRIWSWGAIATLALSFAGCGSSPEEIGASPSPVEPVTVTPEEVQNYAKVILEIEPIRQVALGQVQTLVDSGVAPIIICNDPQSLAGLSSEVTEVIVNFCTQSKEINAKYGLTPTRFNDITRSLTTDAQLKAQIDGALLAQVMNPETPTTQTPTTQTPETGTPETGTPETETPTPETPETETPETETPTPETPETETPETETPTPETPTPEATDLGQ